MRDEDGNKLKKMTEDRTLKKNSTQKMEGKRPRRRSGSLLLNQISKEIEMRRVNWKKYKKSGSVKSND